MTDTTAHMEALTPFVGEWRMEPIMPGAPGTDLRARVTFEWMPGGRFLVERWEVPIPEVPDGLAVIGYDHGRGTYLQHYFDSRGVARVYEMTFLGGVWTLGREKPGFSPLDFRQRWTGTFGPDGRTITGRWEIAHGDAEWETDFGLRYERVT